MIAARSTIAGEGEDVSGTVRIGAPDGFGVAFLAPRLGALADAAPRTEDPARPGAALVLAVASRGRHRHHRRAARPRAGWWRPSWSTMRSASTPRAPMPRRMACPATPAELSAHRLIGYVPDLVISPSLDYAGRVQPRLGRRLLDLVGARPGRGGALGRRHRHPARLHRARHAGTRAGRGGARRSAAPTGWSITRSVRPLRRIQTVAGYIAPPSKRPAVFFV